MIFTISNAPKHQTIIINMNNVFGKFIRALLADFTSAGSRKASVALKMGAVKMYPVIGDIIHHIKLELRQEYMLEC